jgi:pyrimidine-nucleoside phosphorylase
MSFPLKGHLNHHLPASVAEIMSPWLDDEEIYSFQKTIKDWHEKIALSEIKLPKFAPYSTGWPVDKVSLVLVPLVSSAGVVISKISEPLFLPTSAGKQAFYSLDNFNRYSNNLQSIPGFQTSLSPKEIKEQLSRVGAVLFSPPKQMISFFKKIPAPIDFTSWQDRRRLFLSRFMSSILLSGVKGASFDLKVGENFFLKNLQEARSLTLSLKKVCSSLRINSAFILSDISQPLGQAVGNSLEVKEVLEVLKGNGPTDVLKLALTLGTEILLLAKKALNRTEAKIALKEKIVGGEALEKFKKIIEAQKGDPRIIDDYSLLPQARNRMKIISPKKGFIHKIIMKQIRATCLELEREGKEAADSIDHGVGLLIFKKIGEKTEKGETLAEVHFDNLKNISVLEKESQRAFMISEEPPSFQPFIIERTGAKV